MERMSERSKRASVWSPQFAGGDAWRIDGSSCSYGYSKQQAEEICAAHNAATEDVQEKLRACEQQLWNREARWEEGDKIRYLAEKEVISLREKLATAEQIVGQIT